MCRRRRRLPATLHYRLAVLAAVFALCAILVPWLAPLTLPLFVVYWKMADLYRKSSRELKRLENMAETPVYSGFASCMDGLLTIRAFAGASRRLATATDATIDDWAACWLKNNGANRWMGVRLDAIGAALVGLVALFCVLRVDGLLAMNSSLDAGRVGLMLSFAAAVSRPSAALFASSAVSSRSSISGPAYLEGSMEDPDGVKTYLLHLVWC